MNGQSSAIQFLLNGQAQSVADLSPTTTLLDWLRGPAGLRGAKEGCAEGDCGACAVVTGKAAEGRMDYQAVNSCLLMLPQVHGKAVFTVEGLEAPDGALHPVQRALVETDASQCGFCTPGFVMTLFAFHHGGEGAEEATIHDALAGNLCRCTGYRPIVEAAKRIAGGPDDWIAAREASLADIVAGFPALGAYAAGDQSFLAPETLNQLTALRATDPDAHLLAGGTDLGLLVAKERRRLKTVIWVAGVAELNRLKLTHSHLEIGAAVTYSRALPLIAREFPALGAIVRRLGSRQIRNLGTIGGNCANGSPIGDTLPCLIALAATIVLTHVGGRREIPVEAFFAGYRETVLAPGEVIEAIRVPRLESGQQFHCEKISKRFDQDISSVIGAYRIAVADGVVGDIRMAYGGMAAMPKRAVACEKALVGGLWSQAAVRRAAGSLAEDFAPISDFRAGAAYRARVAGNLLERLHLRTTDPEGAVEVAAL